MKKFLIIITIICLSLNVFASDTKVRREYLPEFQEGDIILNKAYLTICFNPKTNVAKWVIYKISDSILSTKLDLDRPTSPKYPQDPDYIVLPKDVYASTGYDSGHLAPAGDFKFNEKAYLDTFYVTNMSPQYGCLNQKVWCHLESHVRRVWTENNKDSIFYVITGPVYTETIDNICFKYKKNEIKIPVPRFFYKVIVRAKDGEFLEGIAFMIENIDIDNDKLGDFKCTIDKIEDMTNINFFPGFTEEEAEKVEGKIGNFSIVPTQLDCPPKNCDSVYSGNRKKPSERTKKKCN